MIKKLNLFSVLFALVVTAQTSFAGSFDCNNSGIPATSCMIIAENFHFGLVNRVVGNNVVGFDFFIDIQDQNMNIGGSDKMVRIWFNYDDDAKKEFEAIAQTAYATKSKLSFIFSDPNDANTKCWSYSHLSTACPAQAISIVR